MYDAARQVNYVTTYTREPPSGGERIGHLTMRMYFPQELDAVLRCSGFSIQHKFGGYQKEVFASDSKKQLIIASLWTSCGWSYPKGTNPALPHGFERVTSLDLFLRRSSDPSS